MLQFPSKSLLSAEDNRGVASIRNYFDLRMGDLHLDVAAAFQWDNLVAIAVNNHDSYPGFP